MYDPPESPIEAKPLAGLDLASDIVRWWEVRRILFNALLFGVGEVRAQQRVVPPRAVMVADHLATQSYRPVAPGISAIKIIASSGVELIALRIKPAGLRFGVIQQNDHQGEWVASMGSRNNALIAFNGGFFRVDDKGHKIPVGLLAIDNTQYSSSWKHSGGYLVFKNGAISIMPAVGAKVPNGDAVLQSRPVLIEPGGKWAMNTNRAIPRKRTIVCLDKNGDAIVVAIVGGGLSLFEAGWLMRGPQVGGYFDCDSAVAMDGGGSTQIWVKDRPDLSFSGETSVQNAVIIQPR